MRESHQAGLESPNKHRRIAVGTDCDVAGGAGSSVREGGEGRSAEEKKGDGMLMTWMGIGKEDAGLGG
ncbi:hypothetical protein MFRU_004g00400 [Monilinia fructicola]|nr:hypothetical protein MFRU_004g00400 [Monilinia fructicola]